MMANTILEGPKTKQKLKLSLSLSCYTIINKERSQYFLKHI